MDRDLELQLIARLRAGDPDAFDALYEALHGRVFNFLARLSNSREAAEDLSEETWLRLVTHAHRLRPDTRAAAWLFAVARNLHASYCRSRLLEDAHAGDLLTLWPSGSRQRTPLEAAEATSARGAARGSPGARRSNRRRIAAAVWSLRLSSSACAASTSTRWSVRCCICARSSDEVVA